MKTQAELALEGDKQKGVFELGGTTQYSDGSVFDAGMRETFTAEEVTAWKTTDTSKAPALANLAGLKKLLQENARVKEMRGNPNKFESTAPNVIRHK